MKLVSRLFLLSFLFFFSGIIAGGASPESADPFVDFFAETDFLSDETPSEGTTTEKVSSSVSEQLLGIGLEYATFLAMIDSEGEFRFSQIPFFDQFPQKMKDVLDKIVMRTPRIKVSDFGISFSGGVEFEGVTVFSRIVIGKDTSGNVKYSVMVSLPNEWKFSNLFSKTETFDPEKFDLLKFEKVALVVSNTSYDDSVLEREVSEGVNLIGTVAPTGPYFEKLDQLSGGNITKAGTLTLHGVIGMNPKLIGTMIMVDLGTGLVFTEWLETTPLTLIVGIEETITQAPTIAIAIEGGLKVKLPKQDWNTYKLRGKFIAPKDFEFNAQQTGMIKNVPLVGLSFGNLGFTIVTDPSLMAETSGILGIVSGLGIKGTLEVGDSNLTLQTKAAISGTTGIGDLLFIIEGDLRLRDLVYFVLSTSEDVANIFKKGVQFKKTLMEKVPNFVLEKSRIAFVPRETLDLKKQIEISFGSVNIFGVKGSGTFYLDSDSLRGSIVLPKIVLGPEENPLFYMKGTGAAQNEGPALELSFDKTSPPSFFSDLFVGTSLLGGIHRRATASLSSTDMKIATEFKWENLFEANLEFSVPLDGKILSKGVWAHIHFKQSALPKIAKVFGRAATKLLSELQSKLDQSQRGLLSDLGKGIGAEKSKVENKIAIIEKRIKTKTDECNQKHSSDFMRGGCYFFKGIGFDELELMFAKFSTDVVLNLVHEGGKAFVIVGTDIAKEVTRPLGDLMKFLAEAIEKGINIRKLDASASLEMLIQGEPLSVNLDMTIAGRNVLVENFVFSLEKMVDLILHSFDAMHGKAVSP